MALRLYFSASSRLSSSVRTSLTWSGTADGFARRAIARFAGSPGSRPGGDAAPQRRRERKLGLLDAGAVGAGSPSGHATRSITLTTPLQASGVLSSLISDMVTSAPQREARTRPPSEDGECCCGRRYADAGGKSIHYCPRGKRQLCEECASDSVRPHRCPTHLVNVTF